MNFCTNCGSSVEPGLRFCRHCGTPVADQSGGVPSPQLPGDQPAPPRMPVPPQAPPPPPVQPGYQPWSSPVGGTILPDSGPLPGGLAYGPPQGETNGLAVASLILGIVWLSGLGALLAIIFGHISKRQIRERAQRGNGMATAGLVLGYLGLAGAIFFILAIVGVIEVFTGQSGHDAQVKSDLRNAGTAEESYLTDYDTYTGSLPQLVEAEILRLSPGTDMTIGNDGDTGYCLVADYEGNDRWFLYDSMSGGLDRDMFGSMEQAMAGCSDPDMEYGVPASPGEGTFAGE